MKNYQKLASCFNAYNNCVKSGNKEWEEKHSDTVESIIKNLPHGSGIDGNTQFEWEKSNDNKLVISSEYHVMDENGMYDGWINFTLTVTPSWNDIDIAIKGNFGKHQELKDYLFDTFYYALTEEIAE